MISSYKSSGTLIIICLCLIIMTGIHCKRGADLATVESKVTVLYSSDEYLLGPGDSLASRLLVFLPLVSWINIGELQPKLAERWDHSDDYRTWTFYLRKDVKWHDEVSVTAHDIKFTIDLWKHPDVNYYVWGIESVALIDEFSFSVTLKVPKDVPRNVLNFWEGFYPRDLLKDLDPKEFYEWDFWTHPVGNGPYRYVRHVPKVMMELEANPD